MNITLQYFFFIHMHVIYAFNAHVRNVASDYGFLIINIVKQTVKITVTN